MKIECPFCNQHYEVENQLVGEKVECSACKASFIIDTQQPIPVKVQTVNQEIKTNVKQGAIIGACACLAIGILLNCLTNFLLFIAIPLYIASFILSIIAMAQRRVVGGLCILLLTLILPPCIILFNIGRFAYKMHENINKNNTSNTSIKAPVAPPSSSPTTTSNNEAKPITTTVSKIKNEITGLCGLNFGSNFTVSDSPKNGKLTSGEIMYYTSPNKTFMGFSEYYVLVTPNTNKIYCILLQQNFKNGTMADEEFEKVDAVLENYYKIKGESDITFGGKTKIYRFDNGNIVIKSKRGFQDGSLELQAYSDDFIKLNQEEKKTSAIKNTDTSAL